MRKSVVLPDPLGPTSPTFSPGFNWNEASTKSNCLPYCLLMFEKEIILKEQLAARCFYQCSVARNWRPPALRKKMRMDGHPAVLVMPARSERRATHLERFAVSAQWP